MAAAKPPTTAHDHDACISRVLTEVDASSDLNHLKLTPQRRRALEILLESHKALGAYDLLERFQAEGLGSKPVTAYRALEFLIRNGFVHKIEGLNAYVACMHPAEFHHPAFMVCRNCRTVAEAESEPAKGVLGQAARAVGFTIDHTIVEAVGLCATCQSEPAP